MAKKILYGFCIVLLTSMSYLTGFSIGGEGLDATEKVRILKLVEETQKSVASARKKVNEAESDKHWVDIPTLSAANLDCMNRGGYRVRRLRSEVTTYSESKVLISFQCELTGATVYTFTTGGLRD